MPVEEPQFLVNAYNDPVIVRIRGKATFQNSAPLKQLFERLTGQGACRFVLDFQDCSGMDSTFLGILAGLGLKLYKGDPKGTVVLTRLGTRNLELIQNLGLHRLLIVDYGRDLSMGDESVRLEKVEPCSENLSEIENARMVLEAHENLIHVDASNQTKFQDVISFLKGQIDS